MLIGLMSDSHDNLPKIEKAVKLFNKLKVELVLHAGDFIAPFVVEKLKNLNCPLIGVFGNNDGEKKGLKDKIESIGGEIHTPPFFLIRNDKKILLVHDLAKLSKTDIQNAELIVYGHTHKEEVKKEDGRLFVNPGECGGWLTGRCTVGLVNLETLEADIKEIS